MVTCIGTIGTTTEYKTPSNHRKRSVPRDKYVTKEIHDKMSCEFS